MPVLLRGVWYCLPLLTPRRWTLFRIQSHREFSSTFIISKIIFISRLMQPYYVFISRLFIRFFFIRLLITIFIVFFLKWHIWICWKKTYNSNSFPLSAQVNIGKLLEKLHFAFVGFVHSLSLVFIKIPSFFLVCWQTICSNPPSRYVFYLLYRMGDLW